MGILLNGAVVSALASVLGKRGLLGEAGSKHAENLKLIAKALGTAFVVKLLAVPSYLATMQPPYRLPAYALQLILLPTISDRVVA